MAKPTTVLEFATQRQDAAQVTQTDAQAGSGQAQADLVTALQAVQDRTSEVAALERNDAALRQALAATPTLADGAAILAQLEQNTIDLRAKRQDLLEAQESLAAAQSRVERCQAILARETADLARAMTLKHAAQEADTKRSGWKTDAGKPPLDTLKADAGAALGAKTYTDAKARVEADIPADLIARARDRRDQEAARVDRFRKEVEAAEDALDDELAANGGLPGATAKKRRGFGRAETAFGNYVLTAKQRFDRAMALLAPIPGAPALSAEEQARINQADIKQKGAAAAAKEKARDDARATLADKQATLDDATMDAIAAGKKPEDVKAVKDATKERDDAVTDLAKKEGEYTAGMRKDLDTWETAVPDAAWRLLADFQEANAILNDLKATDPAALAKAMVDAESDLAGALDAEAVSAEATSFLQDSAAARDDRLDASSRSEPPLLFSALRGDG
jgi:hypothetical protein